jgi:cell division protein FtsQ
MRFETMRESQKYRNRSVAPVRRLRPIRLLLLVCLICSGVLGTMELEKYFTKESILVVRHIVVQNATANHAEEVIAYVDSFRGLPLLDISLHEVASRVVEHPYVSKAEIFLELPDVVRIRVQERQPTAVISLEHLYLVDETGFPFKRALPGDGLDLPLLSGMNRHNIENGVRPENLENALAILRAHEDAGAPGGQISQLHYFKHVGFTMVLEDDLQVELAERHVERDMRKMTRVMSILKERGEKPQWIFLRGDRHSEKVAVRLKASDGNQMISGI